MILYTAIVCRTFIYCKQSQHNRSWWTVSFWEFLENNIFIQGQTAIPELVPQAKANKTTSLISQRAFCHSYNMMRHVWRKNRIVITTNGTYHVVICDTDIHVLTPIERTVSIQMKDFWKWLNRIIIIIPMRVILHKHSGRYLIDWLIDCNTLWQVYKKWYLKTLLSDSILVCIIWPFLLRSW
jgi:hypothetical protein